MASRDDKPIIVLLCLHFKDYVGVNGRWAVGESDDALVTQIYHLVRKCHVDPRATSNG